MCDLRCQACVDELLIVSLQMQGELTGKIKAFCCKQKHSIFYYFLVFIHAHVPVHVSVCVCVRVCVQNKRC